MLFVAWAASIHNSLGLVDRGFSLIVRRVQCVKHKLTEARENRSYSGIGKKARCAILCALALFEVQ